MNIKFGDDNFYVKYLKRFLNNEMSQTSTILGKFDKNDLELLIKYLNLPNVEDMFSVYKKIIIEFPELNKFFTYKYKDNMIQWTAKEISSEISKFIIENLDKIKSFCSSIGWEVSNLNEWVDLSKDVNQDGKVDELDRQILNNIVFNQAVYDENIMKRADLNLDGLINELDINELDNYIISNKLYLEIKMSNRKNYFPNKDMLVFINQFTGTFMYNYAIRDSIGIDDVPHVSNGTNLKIALYQCKPGQKITIAHNSDKKVHLVIGSSPAKLKQDITGFMLQNVVEVDLKAGEGFQYTCSSTADNTGYNANWVCIQCPSNYGNLEGERTVSTEIEVGDINGDGQINLQDYHLLAAYTSTGPGSEKLHWEATARQKVAMDCNKDGVIDNKDTLMFEDYLNGKIMSLGLAPFTYVIPDDYGDSENVSNLLIIDGHYDRSVNIPFMDFITNDWVVHEKFFNYLLNIAIHKYSDSTNITYLQKLLKEAYPEHMYDESFFYPGYYSDNMRALVREFQINQINYTKGDLNRDNRLTDVDLLLLRNYLDDPQHKLYEEDPKNNKDSTLLSEIQKVRADVNDDGYINEQDYEFLRKEVNKETQNLKNYDITFNLGWYDVQTEALFEEQYNFAGTISEVSK